MRQVVIMTLLVGILTIMMQCSRQESINNLMGRKEIVSAPDTMSYTFGPIGPDSLQDTIVVYTDSIRWVYDFPSDGSSSVSIIIGGQVMGKTSYPGMLDSIKANIKLDSTIEAIIRDNSAIANINLDSTIKAAIRQDSTDLAVVRAVKDGVIIGNTNLEVEVYIDGATTTIPLVCDPVGIFIDTVQIATTPLSEVILTESSQLFVRNGEQTLDIIPLENPW